jgi:hypothetical protein
VVGEPHVVGGQHGDDAGRRRVQPGVQRGAQPAVARPGHQPDPVVGDRGHRGGDVPGVGGTVVQDDRFPVRH